RKMNPGHSWSITMRLYVPLGGGQVATDMPAIISARMEAPEDMVCGKLMEGIWNGIIKALAMSVIINSEHTTLIRCTSLRKYMHPMPIRSFRPNCRNMRMNTLFQTMTMRC